MNKSETIQNLAAALNKAQSQITGAIKDSANPFFKSDYADLTSVIKAIKQPMIDNGLSVSQFPVTNDECTAIGVRTLLMHDSGEFIEDHFYLPMQKLTAQDGGSAVTYAKRYSLCGLFNLPTFDDDAEAAMMRGGSSAYSEFLENLVCMEYSDFYLWWRDVPEDVANSFFNAGSKGKKTALKDKIRQIEKKFHSMIDEYAAQFQDLATEETFSDFSYEELKSELNEKEWKFVVARLTKDAVSFYKGKFNAQEKSH